jgi:hypothetical protein
MIAKGVANEILDSADFLGGALKRE